MKNQKISFLFTDLTMLWETGQNSDVLLRSTEGDFKLHKSILAARSQMMRTLLAPSSQPQEQPSQSLTVLNRDSFNLPDKVLSAMLLYCYTDTLAPRQIPPTHSVAVVEWGCNRLKKSSRRCKPRTTMHPSKWLVADMTELLNSGVQR